MHTIAEHEIPIGDADERTGAPVCWDRTIPASRHLLVLARHPDTLRRFTDRLRWLTDERAHLMRQTREEDHLDAQAVLKAITDDRQHLMVVADQALLSRPAGDRLGGEFSRWCADLDAAGHSIAILAASPVLTHIPDAVLTRSGRVVLGHSDLLDRAIWLREPDRVSIPGLDRDGAHVGVAELPTYTGTFAL